MGVHRAFDLMPERNTDTIVEFFTDEAGPSLRVIAKYERNTYDFVYMREEIKEEYGRREFKQHVQTFREGEQVGQSLMKFT